MYKQACFKDKQQGLSEVEINYFHRFKSKDICVDQF